MNAALQSVGAVGEKTRILVIDDDPHVRQAAETALGRSFDVLLASGKREAKEKWNAAPDLRNAIVDLKMPDEKGFESPEVGFQLIEEFRKRPGSVVVVHSAFSDKENKDRAERLGAQAFFPKGADVFSLVETIQRLMGPAAAPSDAPCDDSQRPLRGQAPLTANERRQLDDAGWARTTEAGLLDRYKGQVVVVVDKEVLGAGASYEAARTAALQSPRARADSGTERRFTYVALPEFLASDIPPQPIRR